MKTLLLASAMALGLTTVAYAQDMQTTDDEGQTTQPDMQTPPDTTMPPEEPMPPETTPPESPDTMAPPPDTTAPPPAAPDTTPPTTTPGATTPDMTMPPSGETPATPPAGTMPPTGETPPATPEGTMPPEATPPAGTTPESTAPGGAAAGGMDLDAHFDQFDEDKNGQLSPLEFGAMVASMQGTGATEVTAAEKDRTSKKSDNKATDLINQSADELSKADTNHDFMVSREESAAWHQSGASGV